MALASTDLLIVSRAEESYKVPASEIKSLKQHPFFENDINNRALSKFIKVNYIPSPDTIYNKVKKLPPGSYLKISLSQGTDDLIK